MLDVASGLDQAVVVVLLSLSAKDDEVRSAAVGALQVRFRCSARCSFAESMVPHRKRGILPVHGPAPKEPQ